MSDSSNILSLDDACNQIQGLDIYGDANSTDKFIEVVIEYTRRQFLLAEIELSKLADKNEVKEFCKTWWLDFKKNEPVENDLALIALNFYLDYTLKKIWREQEGHDPKKE